MKFKELDVAQTYKFIEVNGEFEFFPIWQSHSGHAAGRKVASAGMIGTKATLEEGLKIVDSYSMTLKVGIGDLGAIRMANKLGVPVWFEHGEKWKPPITIDKIPDYMKVCECCGKKGGDQILMDKNGEEVFVCKRCRRNVKS